MNKIQTQQQEAIQIRAEINEIGTKKTIQKANDSKIWFLGKIKKINRPLAYLAKGKRGLVNRTRKEQRSFTTDMPKVQNIVRK